MQPQTATPPLYRVIRLFPAPRPTPINPPFVCRHARRALYTTGGLSFIAGQLIDTIHTVSVCLTCGEEFPASL